MTDIAKEIIKSYSSEILSNIATIEDILGNYGNDNLYIDIIKLTDKVSFLTKNISYIVE